MAACVRTIMTIKRIGRRWAFLCFVSLIVAIPAFGTTLSGYRKNIESTKGVVGQLLETVASSELGKRDEYAERELVAQAGKTLPATEKVEWKGGSIETANQWLFAQLAAFQNEQDSTKRGVILTGINERLSAITQQIDELEKPAGTGPTKDDDKQKLAEILKRQEYQRAQPKEESLFQRWMREFTEWLAKVFPQPAVTPGASTDFGSLKMGLQILIFALVIGLVGFLLYRFAPFFAKRFGKRKEKGKGDRVILGDRIGSDESAASLFDEAEILARNGDLRGAIRKGYIALLCELSDRKVIGLARHKTNRDYLRDVRKRTDLFDNMTGLTTNFERNWYGLRLAEIQDWEDFRSRYRQTIAEVQR